ncbi:hypothetical protein ACFL1A_03100 [Patescibacteria group bacterium]
MEKIQNFAALSKINYLSLVEETVIIIVGATVLPLTFHFIPNIGIASMGARFLPMYYAPFLSVVFFPLKTAIIISVLAPYLNHILTGNPKENFVLGLTLHLILYSFLCYVSSRQFNKSIFNAPLSYILSLFIMQLYWYYLGHFNIEGAIMSGLNTLIVGLPGVGALFLLNIILYVVRKKQYDSSVI